MTVANLMNKYKLQFNSHLGSSRPGAIPLQSHCQFAVQAHAYLDCALSAVCIHLPFVLTNFAQGTSTLHAAVSLTHAPALKKEHVDGIV